MPTLIFKFVFVFWSMVSVSRNVTASCVGRVLITEVLSLKSECITTLLPSKVIATLIGPYVSHSHHVRSHVDTAHHLFLNPPPSHGPPASQLVHATCRPTSSKLQRFPIVAVAAAHRPSPECPQGCPNRQKKDYGASNDAADMLNVAQKTALVQMVRLEGPRTNYSVDG
jgi:hypothetical protein